MKITINKFCFAGLTCTCWCLKSWSRRQNSVKEESQQQTAKEQTWKNKVNKLHGVQVFLKVFFFFAKFVNFSSQFGALHVQIINTFEHIIFISCKWWKIRKYCVRSIKILYSTCQRKEKNTFGLNIKFTPSYSNFSFVLIHTLFFAKL